MEIVPTLDAAFIGGFIAGEGFFSVVEAGRRFLFGVTVASHDRPVLMAIRSAIGAGSVHDKRQRDDRWLPQSSFVITGRAQHVERTIPFMDRWLPLPSEKRRQFEVWREALLADVEARPFRVAGTCSVAGCSKPVRGRGLCRSHYYRATGY